MRRFPNQDFNVVMTLLWLVTAGVGFGFWMHSVGAGIWWFCASVIALRTWNNAHA